MAILFTLADSNVCNNEASSDVDTLEVFSSGVQHSKSTDKIYLNTTSPISGSPVKFRLASNDAEGENYTKIEKNYAHFVILQHTNIRNIF